MWIYIPSPTPWSRCCGILHKKRGLFDYLWWDVDIMGEQEKKKEKGIQTNKEWVNGGFMGWDLLAIWFIWFELMIDWMDGSFLLFPFSIWIYFFSFLLLSYHTQHFCHLLVVSCLFSVCISWCCLFAVSCLHFWEETLSSILLWYKNKVIIPLIYNKN